MASRKYKKCIVCNTRRLPYSEVFLAALPLDPARCRLWVQAIGQEDLVHLPIEKLHTLKYVCAVHFAREDFNKQGNRLLQSAVPMQHLPLPPLPEAVFVDFPLHVGWKKERHQSAARDSARAVARDHACTRRFHADHTYVKIHDRDKWVEQLIVSGKPGKTSTEFQRIEARLQDGNHEDHTYVTDKPITLPVGKETSEKRTDVNPDAKYSTQIEVPHDIEPVPEVEETFNPDYEVQVSPPPLSEVEDSGGQAVFSWQREEELIEADEPEEPPAPAPSPPADPTLALYCDPDPDDPKANADPDPDADADLIFDPQSDQAVPSVPAPVDNRCKDCEEVNTGFDFWCVQCAGGALCGACAGRAPHHAHYVLRAPMGCSRARTQAVLTMIRQQAVLMSISQQLENQNISQLGTVDDELKLEVKEEPAEPPAAARAAAEPDPLACEPHEPVSGDELREPELVHELIEPLEPVSLRSPSSLHSPRSSRSSAHSPHSPTSRPDSPLSPHPPASPHEPAVTPEPATHESDKSITEKIVEHHEPPQPRLRKPISPKEILPIPTQRKLVKVSPAEVKRAFLSHIKRVVTTQNKQLKVYQPHVKLTAQDRENVGTAQHKGPPDEGTSRTTRLQVRGPQGPSEPKPSETVTIDLDAADETIEYLEEVLESDIETVDNVDNHEDDFDDDVLDEDYLQDEDDLEEDDLSEEERIVLKVPGRGVKRKKDTEETLPVKDPSETMVRALPSKAVIQVRPLTSLEIRNWTADRKRLRKD